MNIDTTFLLFLLLRIGVFILGSCMVIYTLYSAIRTFILPRSAPDVLVRKVFLFSRRLFDFRVAMVHTYLEKDGIMAMYAPTSLLALPLVWLAFILVGYMGMFWALGASSWWVAYNNSGSALFTLGFQQLDDFVKITLTFSESAIGLLLIALLISYLPTMYAAFSKREEAVTLLEVRAGSPPSATEMLKRFYHLERMDKLAELWITWEIWFVELEESHTSLPALAFFRSPQPQRSWITAAGTVLDTASLVVSTIDFPRDAQADLCIRAGFLALRHIATFFNIPYDPSPSPGDPISITRAEYDDACEQLARAGLPLKPDREQSWRDFAGWRVNYDTVLITLAHLVMAPEAPWITDRQLQRVQHKLITSRNT